MNIHPEEAPRANAWHREPMMWLVLGIPLLTVLGGLSTVVVAHLGADPLVNDAWRSEALGVVNDPSRDRAASRDGLRAEVDITDHTFRVTLSRASGLLPGTLRAVLSNATRASEDRELLLAPVAGSAGAFSAPLAGLPSGHWFVELQPPDGTWRLRGELRATPTHSHLAPPPAS